MIQGDSAHYALEVFFNKAKKGEIIGKDEFVQIALDALKKRSGDLKFEDFKQVNDYLSTMLPEFYDKYVIGANRVTLNEYKSDSVVIDDVPIKIMIDKLEFDGLYCDTADYKTGSVAGIKKEVKPQGKIHTQLAFYNLGIMNDPRRDWKPRNSVVIPVNQEYEKPIVVEIGKEDYTWVRERIVETYKGIKNLEFPGCGEPDCKYCQLNKY
jgi:hypothetical protein